MQSGGTETRVIIMSQGLPASAFISRRGMSSSGIRFGTIHILRKSPTAFSQFF